MRAGRAKNECSSPAPIRPRGCRSLRILLPLLGALGFATSFPAFSSESAGLGEVLDRVEKINRNGVTPPCATSPEPRIDCSLEIETFCGKLYDPSLAPGKFGNQDLGTPGNPISLRYGTNAQGVTHAALELQKARLQALDRLPGDVGQTLRQGGFAEAVDSFLKADSSKSAASLQEKAESLYKKALEDAANDRLEKRHPDFASRKPPPAAWIRELAELEAQVRVEANRAIWQNHPRWKQAQTEFAQVKEAFLAEIAAAKDLPPELKNRWKAQIRSVEVRAPGTENHLVDDRCENTLNNAFYHPKHNIIVLCAGKLTTDVFSRTLAHELAHAVGAARKRELAFSESPLGRKYLNLARAVCGETPAGCSSSWTSLRDDLGRKKSKKVLLEPIVSYQPDLPDLLRCLQRNPPERESKRSQRTWVEYEAERRTLNQISEATRTNLLSRFVNRQDFHPSGKIRENPAYLNPCHARLLEGSIRNPEDLSVEDAFEVFFVAEYQCRKETDDAKRMEGALAAAQAAQKAILEAAIPAGGSFSSDREMILWGRSEDSEERFADWLSSRVYARMLEKNPKEQRLDLLKANLAFLCEKDSLKKCFPNCAQMEKDHNPDSTHSLPWERRGELLNRSLREAVGCSLGRAPKECEFSSK